MALKLYKEESIRAIANAIRRANGTDKTYKVEEMPRAILLACGLEVLDPLPSGYTALSYIASSGTQWIETGIKVRHGDEFWFDFMTTGTVSGEDKGYDVGIPLSHSVCCGGRRQQNDNITLFAFGGNFTFSPNLTFSGALGRRYVEHWTISNGDLSIDMTDCQDGRIYSCNVSNNVISDDYESGEQMFLFAGASSFRYAGAKRIYSTKLKRMDGSLAFNLSPARRDSDGTLGMYDRVTDTFLENAGSGSFIAGPEGIDPDEISAVETMNILLGGSE